MLEPSGEIFLMSIPKAAPNRRPDEAQSANSTRYFCSSVSRIMAVTTSPVKLGCLWLFTTGMSMNSLFHFRGYSSSPRSEEHTSELQSRFDLVCRLLLEKKK